MNECDSIINQFFAEADRIMEMVPDSEEEREGATVVMNMNSLLMFLAMSRFVRSFQTFGLHNTETGSKILCRNVSIEHMFREYMKKVDQGICPECDTPLDNHPEDHDNIPPPASFVKH